MFGSLFSKTLTPFFSYHQGLRYNRPTDDYDRFAVFGYSRNPVVNRCANLISDAAAAIPMNVYVNGELQEDDSKHDAYRLIKRPNPNQGSAEFFKVLYSNLMISGNAYPVNTYPNNGDKKSDAVYLYLLRPDRVTVKSCDSYGYPDKYEYRIENGIEQTYMSDELKHMMIYNPSSDYCGLSPIEVASYELEQHSNIAIHSLSTILNGGRPSGLLQSQQRDADGNLVQFSPEEVAALKESINNSINGPTNASNIIVASGEYEYKEMSMNAKDMDFYNLRQTAAALIGLAYGVPGQLLGIEGHNTYANYEQARLAFYEETVIPLAKRVASDFNEMLPRFYTDKVEIKYDFESIDAMGERKRVQSERAIALWQSGLVTLDEAREISGFGELPNGEGTSLYTAPMPTEAPDQDH